LTLIAAVGVCKQVNCPEQVRELATELSELPLKTLLAAGFITYMPSAPEDQRQEVLRRWMKETSINTFDLRR